MKIIRLFDIKEKSIVIEIGSGYGNMTRLIAKEKWCKKIISIEKEKKLFDFNMKNNLNKKISYLLIDALKVNWINLTKKFSFKKEKIVILGNLPFNISNTLILNLIFSGIKFDKLLFLVQKEVGENWCSYKSEKNKGKRNAISALISFFWNAEIILKKVDKKIFFPIPKVDGIIVEFKEKKEINNFFENQKNKFIFFSFLKTIFIFKRKKISNNILRIYKNIKRNILFDFLDNIGIKENKRIEELDLNKLFEIFIFFNNRKNF